MFCTYCGAENKVGDAKFCTACGKPFSLNQSEPAQINVQPQAQSLSRSLKTQQVQYAGFWIRVGAYCVDLVIMLIPTYLISFLIQASIPTTDPAERFGVQFINLFFNVMVMWVYYAASESSVWQGTIGKKLLGLKVTDIDGARISFGRATGRYFSKLLSALLLGIGFMMVGWTQRKQGLHDKIAYTLVVKK